jgi:hypothetical protein
MAVRWVRVWSGAALLAIVSALAVLFYLWGSAVFWGDRLEAGEHLPGGALALVSHLVRPDTSESVVVFVDCQCPTCGELMGKLSRRSASTEQPERGPSVTLISRAPCELLRSLDPPFQVVLDRDGRIFQAFEIWQVPSVLVVDSDGGIIETAIGWNADAIVWRHIDQGGEQ